MKAPKLSRRFFESTRGRIVVLLRGTTGTVGDLAQTLDLTDNAVRAHLATLERDGLIRQSGLQKGSRKPHFAYELTPEAELLFPKAYDTLLGHVMGVLKELLSPKAFEQALRKVGRSLASRQSPARGADLETRARAGLKALEALGGAARLERVDGKLYIRSNSCPLATLVAEHPEACQVVETQLSEVIGVKVRERCVHSDAPRCRFELIDTEK